MFSSVVNIVTVLLGLLEEKGIVKTGDNHGAPNAVEDDASGKADSSSPAAAGKVSKMDKIKEKLHLSKK
jgi:hypothetical protein